MSTPRRVLIVDDSAMSRRMMRRILERDGHAVIEEADGAAALERYVLEKPALVLLDLIMGGMSGLEVLVELRRLDPAARVIIASADLQRVTRDEVFAAGACGFVGKPFVPADVASAVAAAFAEHDGSSAGVPCP